MVGQLMLYVLLLFSPGFVENGEKVSRNHSCLEPSKCFFRVQKAYRNTYTATTWNIYIYIYGFGRK